jgi:hypothetical protein
MLLWHEGVAMGVEAITRLRDVQAQVRSAQLKRRDAGVGRLVLVVSATHVNRRVLAVADPLIREAFPIHTRTALAALARGQDPGGDALILL